MREFMRRFEWELSSAGILVEGTTDSDYFELASELYEEKHGHILLGDGLDIFAVGERDEGGCSQLQQMFLALRTVLRTDPVDGDGEAIKIICLLDNDTRGLGIFRSLTTTRMGFVAYRDVFLLHRVVPKGTRNPQEYAKLVEQQNPKASTMPCETEDLFSRSLLEGFCQDTTDALESPPKYWAQGHHFAIRGHLKPAFYRYARANAIYEDVIGLIEYLQSFRYALGVDPRGSRR
jgi:hypothetical protein